MWRQLITEIRLLLRHPWHVAGTLGSAVTVYVLLHFGLSPTLPRAAVLPALTLGILMVTLINATQGAFGEDAREGRIAHWHYSRLSLEWIVLCKCAAYMLCCALPLVALFVGIGLQEGVDAWLECAAILALASVSAVCGGLLGASLGLCFNTGQAMAYMLSLPYLSATMIFAGSALLQATSGGDAGNDAGYDLLLAVTLAFSPLAWLACARLLRLHRV